LSASTSCNERALRLLGGAEDEADLARSLARDGCSDELFRIVVEGLADRFEPELCDRYARLFSEVIAEVLPEYRAAALQERYWRVRVPHVCTSEPERVYVLSRVTLGADIAVTSVLLAAAKQRFPRAEIVFVGSAKNAELWAGDERVRYLSAPYPRTGSLGDRLEVGLILRGMIGEPGSVVLDPDSRLTQLGLLPVCEEGRYFFFESRGYGGQGAEALPEIAGRWCEAVLGVGEVATYLALPGQLTGHGPALQSPALQTTVSFGVGENLAKRVGGAFEAGLLREMRGRILVDCGAGGEEARRVEQAILGTQAETWSGSFAGFVSQIARSSLYVGYDSAGQHAAAALGIPLVTVFAGHVSQRMFERWKPTGRGPIEVVNAEGLSEKEALRQTTAAIRRIRTL